MKILLVAGEASGDSHGAKLIRHLRTLAPEATVDCMGGDAMESEGGRLLHHIRDYAHLGVSEVLRHLSRFRKLKKDLERYLRNESPDVFVPIDYPGLNLRLAATARKAGVPVHYYIGPQVWAWGKRRLKSMKERIDRIAVILPFEESIYREAGIPVEYVGHPLLEDLDRYGEVDAVRSLTERDETVALFPGSRQQEIHRILPTLLASCRLLQALNESLVFEVGIAPNLEEENIHRHIASMPGLSVRINRNASELMSRARLALVASGTATLQTGLLGTPLVVVYRTSWLTYFLGKLVVRIPRIGLVNIVAGKSVAPEFLQSKATPSNIAGAAAGILRDDAVWNRIHRDLLPLRKKLKGRGGSRRVAESVLELTSRVPR